MRLHNNAVLAIAATLMWAVLFLVLSAPSCAFAQTADSILPDVQAITGAASAGKWALVLVLALGLGIRFFRGPVLKMLPESNALRVWVQGTIGGWVVNFAGSELAALATYFASQGPVSVAGIISALLGGLMVSFGAAGLHEFTRDVAPKPTPVASPAAAGDVLNLPPR